LKRAAAGSPEHYFFACTRFIARKGVDTLLSAYALYRAQTVGAPWGLVVAGSGEEAGRLKEIEQGLRLEGVVWPGFVQYGRLPLYYGLAGAFVHAAKSEPWGLVVNEAIASGLPVLVSRTTGAASEIVCHGVNGYLFDPHDAQDLAASLIRIAEMPAEARAEMGRASSAVAERWGADRFGAGLLAAVSMGKRGARTRRAA
jgi:glycosyltransferase involved in cell wall biosynthesis